jgi:hypothetical protein
MIYFNFQGVLYGVKSSVNMLKNNYLTKNINLIFLVLIAAITRFSYSIPVVFHPDSVKYFVPLQIIYDHNFTWILDTINFSLLTRIINYFIQSSSDGGTANIILFQKLLGVFSTVLFYLITQKLSNNKIAILISSLIFSLNPLMLFFEQTLMPEALFIFELCLLTLLIQYFTESTKYKTAIAIGFILGLISLTKQIGLLFVFFVIIVLFIHSVFYLSINKKVFISSSVIGLTTLITISPIVIYNFNKFHEIKLDRFNSNCPMLWFLTEEMLLENPSKKHTWITVNLLNSYNAYKQEYKIPGYQKSRIAFESAISNLCVTLRENRAEEYYSQFGFEKKKLNKTIIEYYTQTLINNPRRALEALLFNTNILLLNNNLYFNTYRKSCRIGTYYETAMFTVVPYSLKTSVDPLLKNALVMDAINLDEKNIYTNSSHSQILNGYFPLMVNMDSNKMVLYPEKGFSLWLQKTFSNLTWMKIIFPVFVISLIIFLIKLKLWLQEKNFLFVCYLIFSTLLFTGLPAIVHGESRYQLQFTHFMIWFILAVMLKKFNQSNQKQLA